MTLANEDRQALVGVLIDAEFPELPNFQRGKVRDSYDLPDGRRIMIATDRQSAFDRVLAAVPFKGQVLTQTARFWFDQTTDICPNHVLSYPDPNVVVGTRLKMLPVEMVVRDYLTGSTEVGGLVVGVLAHIGTKTVFLISSGGQTVNDRERPPHLWHTSVG